MFTDSYRDTFAAVGVQLRSEAGSPSAEIADAEKRLGIIVPESLKEHYLLSGREPRVNQVFNRLLPPKKWFTDSKYVVFMEENQCVVYWGVRADREQKADAPVFQGVNRRNKSIEWHAEHESCFTFLNVMTLWHASFGGGAAHSAMGYVDEELTRKTLDEAWDFVGEVNAMRAYKQGARALCFLKWEDFIQKERKLPPWRVFAAAASKAELEGVKTSLQAHWDEWGG